MFEWISHNRELFLVNYTEIGSTHEMATGLQNEHSHFAMNSMVRVTSFGTTMTMKKYKYSKMSVIKLSLVLVSSGDSLIPIPLQHQQPNRANPI